MDLVELKAIAAMRSEDLRIATLHRVQAAARTMSAENHEAYLRQCDWENHCLDRARLARAAVIAAQNSYPLTLAEYDRQAGR